MIKQTITLIFLLLGISGVAQKLNSSPYSFFGIGDPAALKSVEEIGMGKIGATLDSPYQLSFTNPASYASLIYTTYVFSGGNRATKFTDENSSQNSSHAGFTYLSLGIPIRGNQGLNLGLQLSTTVGYSLISNELNDEDEVLKSTHFEGSGGTNRFFAGYGYKFPFDLQLGFEAAYIFGGIENNILTRQLDVQYATKHKTDTYASGYEFKLGGLYTQPLKGGLNLKLAAVTSLASEIKDKGNTYLYTVENTGSANPRPIDTLYTKKYNAILTNPLKTILSVGIGKGNKWFAGVEYAFKNAITYDGEIFLDQDVYSYKNSSLFSVGGFYTPKFNSITNYFQRITYRAGMYYNKGGLAIRGYEINDFGISFGVSLPVSLNISNLNLGVELGKRGENNGVLIEEKYLNFRLSLSLNDKWFRKRRLD